MWQLSFVTSCPLARHTYRLLVRCKAFLWAEGKIFSQPFLSTASKSVLSLTHWTVKRESRLTVKWNSVQRWAACRHGKWQLSDKIISLYRRERGTSVAQCLRYCATNRKVAGSIPDSFTGIFYWLNPSDSFMFLGSTKPLTEMSTRSIAWG
jgi:hypothetical protein